MNLRLADLVAPQSVSNFLKTSYAQEWVYCEGEEHRFRNLADWGTLNDLLATQRFDSPRFRITQRDETIPVESYTEQIETIRNTFYRRIVVDRLLDALRNGATLTIDRVDQAHEPIRNLAATLKSELGAEVFVNAY